MYACLDHYHDSQFGVKLPSERLYQVDIITSRCLKEHLKGFETIVCNTIHWKRQKVIIYQPKHIVFIIDRMITVYRSSQVCLQSKEASIHHHRHKSSCAQHPELSCSHLYSEEYN